MLHSTSWQLHKIMANLYMFQPYFIWIPCLRANTATRQQVDPRADINFRVFFLQSEPGQNRLREQTRRSSTSSLRQAIIKPKSSIHSTSFHFKVSFLTRNEFTNLWILLMVNFQLYKQYKTLTRARKTLKGSQ